MERISRPALRDPLDRLAALYEQAFDLAVDWWESHSQHDAAVGRAFEKITGRSYAANRDRLITGYADHYAEKAFVALEPADTLRRTLAPLLPPALKHELQAALRTRSVVLLTAHYGAVDMLPVVLSTNDIPVSAILRFKSRRARERYTLNAAALGMTLLDASDRLPASLRALRTSPRVLVTVCDAFGHWRRQRGITASWCDKSFHVDTTYLDFARIVEPRPLFVLLARDGGHSLPSRFIVRRYAEDRPSEIPTLTFSYWTHAIEDDPFQSYIWEEMHEIWSLDPFASAA